MIICLGALPPVGNRKPSFPSRGIPPLSVGIHPPPTRLRACALTNAGGIAAFGTCSSRRMPLARKGRAGATLPSRSGLSPHSDFPSPEDPNSVARAKRRTNGRVSSAHPRDWMQLPFPGRADPHAWPQFLGLPSKLTPARRIRPAAASAPKREAARRPPPDSPVASTNTRRGSTNGLNGIRGGGV